MTGASIQELHPLVDPLMQEAWDRKRRRRRLLGAVGAVLIAIFASYAAFGRGGGPGGGGSNSSIRALARPTSAPLQQPDGTIRWLFNHELRGESLARAHLALGSTVGSHWQPVRFARVLTPDAKSGERIVVSLIGEHGRNVCVTVFVKNHRGGGGCAVGGLLPPFSQMHFSIGRGAEQAQYVAGLADDDVARMVLVLRSGRHLAIPLKDNAFVVKTQSKDVPATLVAYDASGQVLGTTEVRPFPRLPQ